jgi:RNA binding exosome subunit
LHKISFFKYTSFYGIATSLTTHKELTMYRYKYFLLLFYFLNKNNLFCAEQLALRLTLENFNSYLKTQQEVPEENRMQLCDHVNNILDLAHQADKSGQLIPRDPIPQGALRIAPLGSLVGAAALYTLRQSIRSPFDPTLLLAAAAGGAAFAGGVYWWMGREMRIIRSFRTDLQQALAELDQMQISVKQLKESNQELQDKIDKAVTVTQELKDALPQVIQISGDHANLATIVGAVLKEVRGQQLVLIQLLNRLPEHERIAMITQAQQAIPDTLKRQADAIIAYNSHSFRRRLGFSAVTEFEQIPVEWLNRHNFNDLTDMK